MMSMMLPFVDVEYNRPFIDELFSDDLMRCLQAIVCVRNSVIGSNRQKGCVINQGVVPKLLQLLENAEDPKIRVEAAVVLGSLAKGTPEHAQELLALGVVPALIRVMSGPDLALSEAALRGLRSLLAHPFAVPPQLDAELAARLIALLPHSVGVQACVASVLASACATQQQQTLLVEAGALKAIHELLDSDVEAVQTPTLRWLAALVRDSPSAAAAATHAGVLPRLADLTSRNRPPATQLAAAAAIAHLHRAGAVPHDDPRILYRALPCLVRLCKKECLPEHRSQKFNHCIDSLYTFMQLNQYWFDVRLCKKECLPEHRAAAAECLAHLTAVDTELQRLASISDQLVPALADMLRRPDTHRLRQAAFKAFASLGANDEEIRKRIIETDNLMDHIVSGLQDSCADVRLSAVRCLHSLSRSVQQLRTTFQDHSVWRPLMALLSNASDDVLTVASSTLCNLLLEFSPAKEPILESGAVGLLCGLTRRPDPALRLNGIWALMNMAFQAEQKIKSQILAALGTDQMFRLLSDSEVSVLMKTLGLLRNLLSTKPHIDHIMGLHGAQIMQAVVLILEGGHGPPVKEQALCILANIADGDTAKDYIMANQDVLRKLTDYMMHSNVKLQVAAIFCVSNLAWRSEPGSAERQARLRDIGVLKLLQQLVVTADTLLFDKVKTAMTQFSDQ